MVDGESLATPGDKLDSRPRLLLVGAPAAASANLIRLLEECGFLVELAETGTAALAVLRRRLPGALLTAGPVPELAGAEFCRTVRRIPGWESLTLILLAQSDASAERIEALRAGADEVLSSAVETDELAARLRGIAGRLRRQSQSAESEKLHALQQMASTLTAEISRPLQLIRVAAGVLTEQAATMPGVAYLAKKVVHQLGRAETLVQHFSKVNRLSGVPPLSAPWAADSAEVPPERAKGAYRLLVVDDDAEIRELVRHALHASGTFAVTEAENGLASLDMARGARPDLVLLDVNMPVMDGFTACAAFKQVPELSDVPIVMLTGRSSIQDMVRGFEAGAVDYLTKPFEVARLPEFIFRALERAGVRPD